MELSIRSERVRIRTEVGELDAILWLPEEAVGMIVFANENGGQRLRPAGDYLPSVLRNARFGTLVFDLAAGTMPGANASPDRVEDQDAAARCCVRAACDWVRGDERMAELPLGLTGVGHGAAAVLHAAAELGRRVCALVARGMQIGPGANLARISAPTLLIAGSLDEGAVEKSRSAYAALRCKKRFEIIPGATRAFDEPGCLEVAARLARCWFLQHVCA